jgi:uncharacterized integral membrane protein
MLDELIKLHQLMHGTGEPLTIGIILLVLVLIQYVINHNAIRFKLFGTIAACKGSVICGLDGGLRWFLMSFARFCTLLMLTFFVKSRK